jgi:hypothetical protein
MTTLAVGPRPTTFSYELAYRVVRLLNQKPPCGTYAMPVLIVTIYRPGGMLSGTAFIGLN